MRRRLCTIAITVALCLLAAYGAYFFSQTKQAEAIRSRFHTAGGSNGEWVVYAEKVTSLFGTRKGKQFLLDISDRYEVFAYDGDSRFCQIYRDYLKYQEPGKYSDAVILTWIIHCDAKSNPKCYWHGPPGMYIDKIQLDDRGVGVTYHIASMAESEICQPDTYYYIIPWKPGTKPEPGIMRSSRE